MEDHKLNPSITEIKQENSGVRQTGPLINKAVSTSGPLGHIVKASTGSLENISSDKKPSGALTGRLRSTGPIVDPFASDVFVRSRTTGSLADESTEQNANEQKHGPLWSDDLSKMTRDEAERSASIPTLALTFRPHLARTLKPCFARYAHIEPTDVSINFLDSKEVENPILTDVPTNTYAVFKVGPKGAPFIIVIDSTFAISFIDKVLGGIGQPPDVLRPLSTAELAVLEFIFLNVARELNNAYKAPLMKLESFNSNKPTLTNGRYLLMTTAVQLKDATGIMPLYLDPEVLSSIAKAYEVLLGNDPSSVQLLTELPRTLFEHMEKIAPEVSLSLMVGHSDIFVANLRQLEPEDVLIIDRPAINWNKGQISGGMRVRLADGRSTTIAGNSVLKDGRLQIVVEQITSGEEMSEIEQVEQQNIPISAEGVAALDGLLLTVHIELGARRIRLDELARMRIGQVLNLGCAPTDPVNITCDGRCVARGELVNIEGRLGVRITQLLT